MHLVFRSVNGQKSELLLGDFKRFTSKEVVKAIKENLVESRKEWLLEQFKKAGAMLIWAQFLERNLDKKTLCNAYFTLFSLRYWLSPVPRIKQIPHP